MAYQAPFGDNLNFDFIKPYSIPNGSNILFNFFDLNEWQYRKKITIQGQSGAGENYQVLLKIGESSGLTNCDFTLEGCSAKFPSDTNDSGDIRFTKSDGFTPLNFWVEKVEGESPYRIVYVWVKITDNLDNDVDIYCYYGNPNAENVSSVTNTFIREIDGLVGSWHCDEGEGSITKDTSGNNNHGTINGATWVDGKFGKALDYGEGNNYTDCGTSSVFDITNKFSLEAWVKLPPNQPEDLWGRIIDKYRWVQKEGYNLVKAINSHYAHLEFWDTNNNACIVESTTALNDNNWHHVVGTYDNNVMKIWIDKICENTNEVGSRTIKLCSEPLRIGSAYDGNIWHYINGIIDEVRVYKDKALTEEEISDLYNNYGYTTPNYPNKVLVRKRVDPEPSFKFASNTEELKINIDNKYFHHCLY